MAEFREGQRVHVEFDATVDYVHKYHDGLVEVRNENLTFSNSVRLTDITPCDPENWPPQQGDIWEAEGQEYAALSMDDDAHSVSVASFGLPVIAYYPDFEPKLDEFKALNPKLVRRRGQ